MKKLTALLVSTTMLAACQQGAGYDQNNNTYSGAAIGAILGGAAGALSDDEDRFKRGAIGAGIGVLTGGAIGQYMDRQEQDLRTATQGTGIDVERQGENLLLNLPSNITFASGSSAISGSLIPTLDNVAAILKQYPQTTVGIAGHTDNVGSDNANMILSERRASSVANHLINRGVTQRIVTIGRGEAYPVASNANEAGRAQNRRVEIKITPITQ